MADLFRLKITLGWIRDKHSMFMGKEKTVPLSELFLRGMGNAGRFYKGLSDSSLTCAVLVESVRLQVQLPMQTCEFILRLCFKIPAVSFEEVGPLALIYKEGAN